MATTTKAKEKKGAHVPSASYSLQDAAKHLKKSEATVKRYKSLLLKVWTNDLDRVVIEATGSLTQHGLDELSVVAGYVSNGDSDGYEAATINKYPELADDEPVHEPLETVVEQRFQAQSGSFEIVAHEPTVTDLRLGFNNSNLDLSRIRGEIASIHGVTDILSVADQVLEGAEDAINDDLAQQQLQLSKIQGAALELRGKRQALELRKRAHQERSLRLQVETNLALEDFQSEMGRLQD